MLDHRRGQVFNFLRSRLALPGVHRPVFLFESLTGAFQTPFSPFDPSLSLSPSLLRRRNEKWSRPRSRGYFKKSGTRCFEERGNRSRIQLKPIEQTASVSLFPNLFAISTIFYRAFARQRFRARPKEKSERRSTNDWLRERSRESGTAVLVVPFKNIQEEGGRGRSAETTREAWKKF